MTDRDLAMTCPKCGFEQPEGLECLRCGIVFAKYHAPTPAALPETPPEKEPNGAPAQAAPPEQPVPPPGPRPIIPLKIAPSRPFESGAILGETFSIYFGNFLPFVILTAVAFSPILLLSLFASPESGPLGELAQRLATYGGWLCTPIATAAVTYGVFQQMRRREASIGDCLSVGLSCLLPVLFVAILAAIAQAIGMVMCVVPGILVAVMLAVAVPAAVEERPGAFAALRRSQDLTDGYRWPVFGVLFLLGLLNIGLGLLAIPLLGGLEGARAMSENPTQSYLVMSNLLGLVPVGLGATASAVMYYRLRSIKESIDVEEIASVFD